MKLADLGSEMRNPETMNLDTMTTLEFVEAANREDAKVALAINEVLPQIAQAIDLAVSALKRGGRLFYMGAGTSGRIGVLDASECPPTFGVPQTMVNGLIAGGEKAILCAVEGAEDDATLAGDALRKEHLTKKDMVIGIAASGRTPYVLYGLRYAKSIGCATVAIACNRQSEIGQEADVAIEPETGPELLTGSTRLKAGTAQKMILNMISTGSMVQLGKVYENLMIDLECTNQKLEDRAERIVMAATGCERELAREVLKDANNNVKRSIVMILAQVSKEEAENRLEKTDGDIRSAIGEKG